MNVLNKVIQPGVYKLPQNQIIGPQPKNTEKQSHFQIVGPLSEILVALMPRKLVKRSLIPTLPNMTEIGEGVEELIDDVALGNVDELVNFLRPDMLRVSLVIL